MDPEKTDPNWRTRLAAGTAKADGPADRVLRAIQAGVNWCFERAIGSGASAWIIVGVLIILVWFGFRVVKG